MIGFLKQSPSPQWKLEWEQPSEMKGDFWAGANGSSDHTNGLARRMEGRGQIQEGSWKQKCPTLGDGYVLGEWICPEDA